jgi:Helix-turn-helix domain
MKRGRLTEQEIASLEDLRGQGLSRQRIARAMDRHPSTIEHALVRLGLHSPKPQRQKPYVRNGVEVRPFTEDEDLLLTTLRIAGHRLSVIARAMTARFGKRRTTGTVAMRLKQLAAHAEGAQ